MRRPIGNLNIVRAYQRKYVGFIACMKNLKRLIEMEKKAKRTQSVTIVTTLLPA